jgi:hypothetical protein
MSRCSTPNSSHCCSRDRRSTVHLAWHQLGRILLAGRSVSELRPSGKRAFSSAIFHDPGDQPWGAGQDHTELIQQRAEVKKELGACHLPTPDGHYLHRGEFPHVAPESNLHKPSTLSMAEQGTFRRGVRGNSDSGTPRHLPNQRYRTRGKSAS